MDNNNETRFPANEKLIKARKETHVRGNYDKKIDEWRKEIQVIQDKEQERKKLKREMKRLKRVEMFYDSQKVQREKELEIEQHKLSLSKLGIKYEDISNDGRDHILSPQKTIESFKTRSKATLPQLAPVRFQEVVRI